MKVKNQTGHELRNAIAAIVGPKYVSDDYYALIPYARDISAFPGVMPGVVVRPKTSEEVSEIVKLANRTGYPITVKGGGQAGGGVTKGEATRNIMLDMGRMDSIEVDTDNLKVTVGAGARLSTIDDALRPYNYYINSVIGPYFTATAGGLTSGIAGAGFGKNVATSGCNNSFVLGLKVVLPNGDVVTTGASPDANVNRDGIYFREVTGPDLTDLFMASGGAFGLITEVIYKIIPIPEKIKSISYVAPSMEVVWDIYLELSKEERVPYSNTIMFEMTNYMVKPISDGIEGYGAMFFSVEGDYEEDIDSRIQNISDVCEKHSAIRGNDKMDYFAKTGCTGTMEIVHDVPSNSCPFMTWETMYPRAKSLEFTKGLLSTFYGVEGHRENATAAGLYLVPMGHIFLTGVTIRSGFSTPAAEEHLRKTWRIGEEYMRKNGTSSAYAQGTNTNFIAESWSPIYSKMMNSIKNTFDPNNIMCPGLWNF
ncbi:MAG: FAD-binding oxidoreductase [Eubacteriaceae bacterium]